MSPNFKISRPAIYRWFVTVAIWQANQLSVQSATEAGQVRADSERDRTITADSSSLIFTRRQFDPLFVPLWRGYLPPEVETRLAKHWPPERNESFRYYLNKEIKLSKITEDDLILESLDQSYKSRLIEPFSHRFDRAQDRQRASDPAKVSRTRCDSELDFLLDTIDNLDGARRGLSNGAGLTPELGVFLDAFGNQEAGLLLGNSFWVGQWQQCRMRDVVARLANDSSDEPDELMRFGGRYCVASLVSPAWAPKINEKAEQMKRSGYFKYERQQVHYRRHFKLQVGACLPESCDSTLIERRPDDLRRLVMHKLNSHPVSNYKLDDLYCLPDDNSELRQLDTAGAILVSLILIWATGIIWASLEHWRLGPAAPRLALSLSVLTSFETLSKVRTIAVDGVADKRRLSAQDMTFLSGIRVLLIPFVMISHSSIVVQYMSRSPLDYDAISPFLFYLIAGSAYVVDWYFCMSGFLSAYTTLVSSKRPLKERPISYWIYTILQRWVRQSSLYLLLFAFMRHLFHLTGDGPLWDYGTSESSIRAVCRQESWLMPLTLTANLHPIHRECIMPAWYVSAEMQFYLITPPLLIVLSSWPRAGWLLGAGGVLGSMLVRYRYYLSNPHVRAADLLRPGYDMVMRNNWDLPESYLYPHFRIAPYLVGLLAGHYVYLARSRATKLGGWLYAAAYSGLGVGLTMLSAVPILESLLPEWLLERQADAQTRLVVALFYGSHHALAGLTCALVCAALALGAFAPIRRLLEHPILTRLARFNYFVYLVQVELFYWLLGRHRTSLDTSVMEVLKLFASALALIYPLALLVTLTFTMPLTRLEAYFVAGRLKPAPDTPHRRASVSGADQANKNKA